MLWAERSLKSGDVPAWLQKAIQEHGAPEFIAKIVQRWLKENGVKTIYIEPGKSLAERVCGEFSRTFPG